MTDSTRSLALSQLEDGCPALTRAIGRGFAEAASICLENQEHKSVASLQTLGDFDEALSLLRLETDDQMRRSHNDLQDATEAGACGLAILLVQLLVGYTVVERSVKGTGFDYWLGSENDLLFQNKARLEVSGILRGDQSGIKSRVKEKLDQTKPTDGTLPAYIVVVEFSGPHAHIEKK